MDMSGKVSIVTGASAGIGRAYALALASQGATVIAAARTLGRIDSREPEANTLAEVVKTGASLPGRLFCQVCDVEHEPDLVRMVDQAAVNFGRIDVLVNNAALLREFDPFDVTGEDWDRMMATNLRAAYLCIRQVAPHMIRQRSGSIINVTAASGNFSPQSHYPRMLPYSVSKAALNRLTYFMAAELGPHGIAVNSLSPGSVATPSALKNRPEAATAGTHKPATPEVLGPALLYLAHQTADTLTGQILHTDEFQKSWPPTGLPAGES
jgi:NAD(P)-dependent dehydrogenase (short-subunit alcohol dehydrogenase family)